MFELFLQSLLEQELLALQINISDKHLPITEDSMFNNLFTNMYNEILLSLIAVACTLPTDLVPTHQCLYNGQLYPPGAFQPSVCVHCQCSSTEQVTCAPQFCLPPICVDVVKDPSKCCPVCPNGNLIQIILKMYIFIKTDAQLLSCVSQVTYVLVLIHF